MIGRRGERFHVVVGEVKHPTMVRAIEVRGAQGREVAIVVARYSDGGLPLGEMRLHADVHHDLARAIEAARKGRLCHSRRAIRNGRSMTFRVRGRDWMEIAIVENTGAPMGVPVSLRDLEFAYLREAIAVAFALGQAA